MNADQPQLTAPLRPSRRDPWLLEEGLWPGGTSTSHVPCARVPLRDIGRPTAAAGAGHHLGRTGKSSYQPGALEGRRGQSPRSPWSLETPAHQTSTPDCLQSGQRDFGGGCRAEHSAQLCVTSHGRLLQITVVPVGVLPPKYKFSL